MQLCCIADCSVYVPKDVFCRKSEKKRYNYCYMDVLHFLKTLSSYMNIVTVYTSEDTLSFVLVLK